jgi:hypothetical protein
LKALRNILRMPLRWLLLVTLLPALLALALTAAADIIHSLPGQSSHLTDPMLGLTLVAMGVALRRWVQSSAWLKGPIRRRWSQAWDFLDTLEHELTHIVAGLLFLRPPRSLHASDNKGGYITLERTNLVISLAPYLLPLWSGMVLVLSWLVADTLKIWFARLAALLFGFYLARLLKELHRHQSDLNDNGFLFSRFLVLLWHLGGISLLYLILAGFSGSTISSRLLLAYRTCWQWLLLHSAS